MKVMDEEIIKPGETETSTPETDLSKIKIRHILAQRIKKSSFRKIICIILLAVVCFCGGFLTDRFVMRHAASRRFYGRPGIQRHMPGNFNGNRSFRPNGQKKTQLPPLNKTPSQNQPQGSAQTTPQTPQSKQ